MPDLARVQITGLREVGTAMHRCEQELPKEIRLEFRTVAESVASTARRRIPRRSGRAAGSIRVLDDPDGATVRGGLGVPYYGWLDFGGTLRPSGARRNTQVRTRLPQGRAILPAVRSHEGKLRDAANRSVDKAVRKAGL